MDQVSNGGSSHEPNDVDAMYNKYFRDIVSIKVASANKEPVIQLSSQGSHISQGIDLLPSADDIWIFGYGSLVWKADFPYIDRRQGFICGYKRCFYQNSIDHRGTHDKPGRVVTLLHTSKKDDRVYGVAYRIAASQKEDVLQHLDYREKNGYERRVLEFHEFPDTDGVTFDIIMYVATQENESYAGHLWELPQIAEQIFTSAGPSGPNREYLFNLAHAMRTLFPGVHDEHLFDLEQELLKRIENDEERLLESALKREIAAVMLNQDSTKLDSNASFVAKKLEALKNSCEKVGWREMLLSKELLKKEQS